VRGTDRTVLYVKFVTGNCYCRFQFITDTLYARKHNVSWRKKTLIFMFSRYTGRDFMSNM